MRPGAEGRGRLFVASLKDLRCPTGANGSCATAPAGAGGPDRRPRRSRSVASRCATAGDVPPEEKIRFSSTILPQWARRSRSLDALLPVLYLRGSRPGISRRRSPRCGQGCAEPVAGVISRLTAGWQEDYDRWQHRDLSARRYVYVWADGVYLQARMEAPANACW